MRLLKIIVSITATLFLLSVMSAKGFDITWKDNSSKETKYVLEKSLDGESFQVLAELPANATAYNDASPEEGEKHYYRVKAVKETLNDTIESPYSSIASATFPLNAPSNTSIKISISE